MRKIRVLGVVLLLIGALILVGCQPAAPPAEEPAEEEPASEEEVAEEPAEEPAEEEAAEEEVAEEPMEEEPLKVALLLYGPLSDTGWNGTAYQGLLDAEAEFGVEVAFSENLDIPDIEQAIRDYANQDYDLIIGHSFPFMDPMVAISPEYPETFFTATNGFLNTDNMASFFPTEVQSHYLAGILFGMMTESNVIGVVGGVELPNMIANFNALEEGVASVNPDAEVLISYVGSWGDPAGGKEAALAQFNNGADIMLDAGAASGLGTLEACAENNIPVVSFITMDSEAAPESMIGTILPDFREMIRQEIELVVNGDMTGTVYNLGLDSKVVHIIMSDDVPADVQAAVREAEQAILDGSLVVEAVYE